MTNHSILIHYISKQYVKSSFGITIICLSMLSLIQFTIWNLFNSNFNFRIIRWKKFTDLDSAKTLCTRHVEWRKCIFRMNASIMQYTISFSSISRLIDWLNPWKNVHSCTVRCPLIACQCTKAINIYLPLRIRPSIDGASCSVTC